ncbi:MAG: ATP phosphoribosyltransferase, partial [Mariprofundaceae bacterium]
MTDTLTIALSKGRILEQTLPLLKHAGLTPVDDVQTTRKLMVDGPVIDGVQVRFLIIRAADVCTYVEQGAADMGISGRDLLLEHRPHVYEPLDLKIGCCRVCICGLKGLVDQGKPSSGSRIRVATKYDYLAEQHYLSQGIQAEIIHLYGGMELAPLVGMSDRIVDIVETGSTLKANGLIEEETLYHISSRLIVNPASAATKRALIH